LDRGAAPVGKLDLEFAERGSDRSRALGLLA
jgi:hypothetical protein